MSLLLTLSDDSNKAAFTPRAAALLAVITDVRMYVINNSEVCSVSRYNSIASRHRSEMIIIYCILSVKCQLNL